MKSLEDRYEEAKEDPVKVKRAFTAIWVASYAMLILGAFIIVGVLIYERLLRTKKQGPSGPIFHFTPTACTSGSRHVHGQLATRPSGCRVARH